MPSLTIDTKAHEQIVDITTEVRRIVSQSGVADGLCHVWCHHTTAGITINENSDEDVKHDLIMGLDRIISESWSYRHAEGNSPAHLKSSLFGCQVTIPIENGALVLGTWQGIMFAEFDGPRKSRKVTVTVIPRS